MNFIIGIILFMLGILVGSSITMAIVTKANEKDI
jgi:hypothetical protein